MFTPHTTTSEGLTLEKPEEIVDNRKSIAIGRVRVLNLARRYQDLGYLVIGNWDTHEGVDLIIISLPNGKIWKVIESTNFKEPYEKIADNRLLRYINSLDYFDGIEGIQKELIVSYLDNLTAAQLEELKQHRITVTAVGSQDKQKAWVEE